VADELMPNPAHVDRGFRMPSAEVAPWKVESSSRAARLSRFLYRTRLRILLLRIFAGRPPDMRQIQKALKQ
jgi:hypothetical protein